MVKGLIDKVGNTVKKVAGGAINKTLARLKGAGIQGDSRITEARAKWSGRADSRDWRVRLTIPIKGDELYNAIFDDGSNKLLEPLVESRGMFWPLTPSMVIQHSANYNALAQTHSNFPFQAYQNSQVDQMNIVGEFPVQNYKDAQHWVATIQFLRACTKMFFGQESRLKGNPPPILHLNGYGDHMFTNIPVVVNTFNVELRSGIDYISTKQSNVYKQQFNDFDEEGYEAQTWAPTMSLISVLVTPVYSRNSIKNFSLSEFAKGNLSGSGKDQTIGFI